MKIETMDGSTERRVLIAAIVDPIVLGRIATKWNGRLFRSKYVNLIASWAVKYYGKYNVAPGKEITALYESWASVKIRDAETVQLVESFLSSLSGQYESLQEESNSQYLIDLAAQHFNDVALTELMEQVKGERDTGQLEKALERIAAFGRIEMGVGAGIDVLQDEDAIRDAFAEKSESIIKYPDALGQFYGDALERDGFIAFCGPEKRGKSGMLIDVAWRAITQRRKVAMFQVGDLSQRQIMRRFMARAARRPIKPQTIKYPVAITREKNERRAVVSYEEKEYADALDWRAAWASCEKLLKHKIRSNEPMLRLSCHPTSTINVNGIRSILQGWERDGWGVPDCVIIDYADILAPIDTRKMAIDQINENWAAMRALSQSLHCLVITATQANAASYNAETVGRKHFSNDKRKMAHVTGMIGLSQISEEKAAGVIRQNWMVLREAEYGEEKCVYVAQCLSVWNAAVLSCW